MCGGNSVSDSILGRRGGGNSVSDSIFGGVGGNSVSDSILGGEGTSHFFLLTLYNFKNIGGGTCRPPGPPCSAIPELISSYYGWQESKIKNKNIFKNKVVQVCTDEHYPRNKVFP